MTALGEELLREIAYIGNDCGSNHNERHGCGHERQDKDENGRGRIMIETEA